MTKGSTKSTPKKTIAVRTNTARLKEKIPHPNPSENGRLINRSSAYTFRYQERKKYLDKGEEPPTWAQSKTHKRTPSIANDENDSRYDIGKEYISVIRKTAKHFKMYHGEDELIKEWVNRMKYDVNLIPKSKKNQPQI